MRRYYKRMATACTTRYGGKRPTAALIACVSAVSLLAPLAAQSPVAETPRLLALDPRWALTFTTAPSAPPGFDQQTAYVPLKGGELLAVSLDTGRVRWSVDLAVAQTPATGDGLVFVSTDSVVATLDQETGRTLWRRPLPQPLSAPLSWDSGWLLASTAAGDALALAADDGRELWRTPLGAPFASAPSAAGDRVFVALTDGRVVSLGVEDGVVHWSVTPARAITGLLALDEQLLVGTRADGLHSLALDNGRVRWAWRTGGNVLGAPAADADHIYVAAFDNVLRALKRSNGNLQWSRTLPTRPRAGPLRADNVVFVPFVTSAIGAYRAATGAEAFTIRALGELGGVPFLRDTPRATAPRLIAVSREGALQGFAARFEAPPAPMGDLPGVTVGH